MDLIASFNAHKVRTSHFLTVDGILKDGVLHFLFDTGAVVSLIGLNSFFTDDEYALKQSFEKIICDEIASQGISARSESYKTATNQIVTTYPCVSHGVSIEGSTPRDFYFDFSFSDVSLPLLGSAFTDDCAYSHTIGGNLTISGMKDIPAFEYYKDYSVLEFDEVIKKLSNRI